jgi:hypothetical protein
MTAAVVVGSSSCSNSSSSRRLLTSVAIIGRENEPIYLLGDLWDGDNDSTVASPTKTIAIAAAATEADHNVDATTSTTHPKIDNNDGETDQIASVSPPTTNNSPPKGRGLFGRIMKKNNDDASNITSSSITNTNTHQQQQQQQLNDNIDDDDPFGFFESSYSNPHHRQQHRMSLAQQLILHASLDVFEEKASSSRSYSGKNLSGNRGRGSASGSGGGGVRWRTPGTDSATSMYIGLLCRVEERWCVYGEFYCILISECVILFVNVALSFFHHCR